MNARKNENVKKRIPKRKDYQINYFCFEYSFELHDYELKECNKEEYLSSVSNEIENALYEISRNKAKEQFKQEWNLSRLVDMYCRADKDEVSMTQEEIDFECELLYEDCYGYDVGAFELLHEFQRIKEKIIKDYKRTKQKENM
jgi:hypothetical protein